MCRWESWTIKKAECQRTDAFELWCWRRLLRVPWTAMRSNQSILKEISPECSLEGPMLKLKLQYFGHLLRRTDSFEKILMLGKIQGRRRRGRMTGWDGWMASPARWTWLWVNSGSWWGTGRPGVLQSMGSQRVRQNWVTEPLPLLPHMETARRHHLWARKLVLTRHRICQCLILEFPTSRTVWGEKISVVSKLLSLW